MKAILLCAGYAVRLYPLTKDCPKPLLKIGERPMIDHLLERLKNLALIDQVIVVTNSLFGDDFRRWRRSIAYSKPLLLVQDPSTSNENRLGAIKDLDLCVSACRLEDDLLVIAGDNLFDFSLEDFTKTAVTTKEVTIGVYDIKDRERARNFGLVEVNAERWVSAFYEKPENPPTTLTSIGIYFLPRGKVSRIGEYLREKENNTDQPGYFFRWLSEREKVFAYFFEGIWYDVGSIESYQEAEKRFASFPK